ncbi:hypothetical protein ACJ72_08483 [Emergomyces africanus]|uniref:SP-RING-type domain-containing protein n=1 Tax=Emergomyces africanus TaxID=1955775 RepID=A0A1B7NK55_9EURO|nr:hypothetical protein ACJ72_08483 [Emergomyces africanus]
MVHESKYPGDEIPPLPHSSTWFANTEQSTTTSEDTATRSGGAVANIERTEDDSDDLAIHSERASLRCPITLLPFTDPVKSRKCPHSFEREAIVAMIERMLISVYDLEMDVVAARRLRRAEERKKREDEEEGDDEDGEDVDVGDEDGDEDGEEVVVGRVKRMGKGKERANVKTERERGREREGEREESREVSVVPDTQMVDIE